MSIQAANHETWSDTTIIIAGTSGALQYTKFRRFLEHEKGGNAGKYAL
jgi:hypothetical protein